MLQKVKRPNVITLLVRVWHWPLCVSAGDRVWNIRTVPVGRSFAKCAVPLKAFLTVFCVAVLGGFWGTSGAFSKRGCWVFTLTSMKKEVEGKKISFLSSSISFSDIVSVLFLRLVLYMLCPFSVCMYLYEQLRN